LAEAVMGASGGDTIEIRGNGPFVTAPIRVPQSLTIRAGKGFRPVIKLRSEGQSTSDRLLSAYAPLAVEGLEFQLLFDDERVPVAGPLPLVLYSESTLCVAHCRFVTKKADCINSTGPICQALDCEFLCAVGGVSVGMSSAGLPQRLIIDNCLLTESPVVGYPPKDCSVQLSRNTFRTRMQPFWLNLGKAAEGDQPVKSLRVEAVGNVFDACWTGGVFLVFSDLPAGVSPQGDWESPLATLAAWNGRQNLFAGTRPLLALGHGQQQHPGKSAQDLPGWRQFWKTAEAGSLTGTVRYQGGDLLAKVDAAIAQVTSYDFRLRPDSAGYRAGPDGKDLGADVQLVGPGRAYERWKQSPAYQQWQTATIRLLRGDKLPERD
jgi:hypothetical protein